jgi:hypothetical protein
MKEKYGFVYIWMDSARSKEYHGEKIRRYYIGAHWGTEDDGYICSSNWMRDAYRKRPQDFGKRRILKTNISSKEKMMEEEHKWLQLIKKEELGKKYYNLKNHKFPFPKHDEKTKKTQFKLGQEPWNKNKEGVYSEETLALWSYQRKGKETWMKGKTHTQEAKDKVSQANKGNIAWNKGIFPSESTLEKMKPTQFIKGQEAWNKGKQGFLSEEGRQRLIESNQRRKGKPKSEETKERMKQAQLDRREKERLMKI